MSDPKCPVCNGSGKKPFPLCPQCDQPVKRVSRSPNSYMTEEQFDAVKAGDWFCDNCSGDRGQTGYAYFWQSEIDFTCDCEWKPKMGERVIYFDAVCGFDASVLVQEHHSKANHTAVFSLSEQGIKAALSEVEKVLRAQLERWA
ncbi:MAG: hypothetical protein AMXMBFR84_37650 [Candidatus Hydrogenedentota bacterium]